MDWQQMQKYFSHARVDRYKSRRNGDLYLAAADYSRNIRLAEAMVPMLNVLEITLRNRMHARLTSAYGRDDWWVAWEGDATFSRALKSVDDARAKLISRREAVTADKVLAELTFGFWCSLFNAHYQDTLWKDLRLAFPRCPKDQRKRSTISRALNQIRDLRNRVFHHEPLLWLLPDLRHQHGVGVNIINWVDPQLGLWLQSHDRLPDIWNQAI